MYENRKYIEEEIDLVELFKTVIKRKWFIVGFTFMVTLGAIVFAYMKIPVYEVKSNVKIGYIGKDLLGNPNTINKELRIVFNVDDKLFSKEPIISNVTSVSVNKIVQNFLEIKTESSLNEKALEKNKEVVSYIQSMHKRKIENFKRKIENEIENIEKQILYIETIEIPNTIRSIEKLKTQEIIEISEKIEFLRKYKIPMIEIKIKNHENKLVKYSKTLKNLTQSVNGNEMSNLVISIQMVNYQNMILNINNKISDLRLEKENINKDVLPSLRRAKENIEKDNIKRLERKINITLRDKKISLQKDIENLMYKASTENIENSKVVGDYIISDYPIKPKKKLIVVVAFVTGFILSIFLVFLMEFINNIKRKEGKLGDNKIEK